MKLARVRKDLVQTKLYPSKFGAHNEALQTDRPKAGS